MKNIKVANPTPYQSTLTRRESLKWLGILSASALIPGVSGCDGTSKVDVLTPSIKGHWTQLSLSPISAKGYGKDPNLIIPLKSPWKKTLTIEQLTLVAIIADILVPREGDMPSASEVKVPDVVDEWISAPYERQQRDRLTILSLLKWLDDEAKIRGDSLFIQLKEEQQLEIIDDIAYRKEELAEEFKNAAHAFSKLRKLVLAAFFCTPEGTKDLGYIGNIAIAGDYPGPSEEALVHLNDALDKLGLTL